MSVGLDFDADGEKYSLMREALITPGRPTEVSVDLREGAEVVPRQTYPRS